MMKKLTFCLFASNDAEREPQRVSLCLQSLLDQTTNKSCIIFFDCSTEEQTNFNLPEHPDLLVVRRPTSVGKKWNRSVIRNEMALMVKTPIMCQVCADCIYSPNFAEAIISHMGDGNKFICCKRRETSQEQMFAILNGGIIKAREMANSLCVEHHSAFGECQGIMLDQFMAMGGYFRLIKDGTIIYKDWNRTAGCDDANLMAYIRHRDEYVDEKHTITEVWMDDAWVIHLWHQTRENRNFWENNKFGM